MRKREDYFSKKCPEKEKYLKKLKTFCTFEKLSGELEKLKGLTALVIGDSVIDQYVYVTPKGRAIKDPILSTEFQSEEDYAGGVLALANHLSSYIKNLELVTLLGEENSYSNFIAQSLSENIKLKKFTKKNSPTTIKKRYIDCHKNNKLFKVEYINDHPVSKQLSHEITNYLMQELPKHDLVITLDYGHGFLNEEMRKTIQNKSKFLSLNVQLNSASMGYNYINQYGRADFIVMNEHEIRLPMMMRFEEMEEVMSKFHDRFEYSKFLVTLGKGGCILYNHGKISRAPILTNNLVDTVGAGDAVFAVTSLLAYLDINDGVMPFIANCAGGVGVNIIGNKESVSKNKLLSFIREIYDGME
jgi:bifunctional ADP-heptose synthase (sugar kinase/adenylyltransferase)